MRTEGKREEAKGDGRGLVLPDAKGSVHSFGSKQLLATGYHSR